MICPQCGKEDNTTYAHSMRHVCMTSCPTPCPKLGSVEYICTEIEAGIDFIMDTRLGGP